MRHLGCDMTFMPGNHHWTDCYAAPALQRGRFGKHMARGRAALKKERTRLSEGSRMLCKAWPRHRFHRGSSPPIP